MAPRCGTLTAALALARLQRLLDDVAWSAAQYDEAPHGKPEAGQLERLAHRLQQVIDVYTDAAACTPLLTLDLDPDECRPETEGAGRKAHDAPAEEETALAWYHAQEEAARAADARRANEA